MATYVAIERCANFEEKGRLPRATEGRPPEVAAWMKKGRELIDFEINDVRSYGRMWWRWWQVNQPDERPSGRSEDWLPLALTGSSGLVLFLLSSAWWGAAVIDADPAEQQLWLDAIDDMLVVFKAVLQCVQQQRNPLINTSARYAHVLLTISLSADLWYNTENVLPHPPRISRRRDKERRCGLIDNMHLALCLNASISLRSHVFRCSSATTLHACLNA